jgi:hypothetical protein
MQVSYVQKQVAAPPVLSMHRPLVPDVHWASLAQGAPVLAPMLQLPGGAACVHAASLVR